MAEKNLKQSLQKLFKNLQQKNLKLSEIDESKEIVDFKVQQALGKKKELESLLKATLASGAESKFLEKIKEATYNQEYDKAINLVDELTLTATAPVQGDFFEPLPPLAEEIKEELELDYQETKKCFQTGAYRSAIILCGRILEVALHRKYFDLYNQDILETNPGIGLGKLIAKLKEKNIDFDPGVSEQIHLINNVRVSSVHKKQKTFYPSKNQTQAMILYTLDILKKLF